ncbi:MAG: DUF4335 domain-containing protein [Spirulina sp.]
MLIRRYTPPTCTLEIMAERSPFARFRGRSLADELRFELRFDDPRKIQEDPPVLRGDREQLDRLCDLVATYVQDFLGQSSPPRLPLLATASLVAEKSPSASVNLATGTMPHLQPKGLLLHELVLGNLASENSVERVPLSATQLFDLATALDRYSAESDRLPRSSPFSAVPLWAKVAALLVVAVGAPSAIALLGRQPSVQIATTSESLEEDSPATVSVKPLPPLPESPPAPNPDFPKDLAGRGKVAPPPTVTTPVAPKAPFVIPGPPRPLNQSQSSPSSAAPPPEAESDEIPPGETPTLPNLPAVTTERRERSPEDILETAPLPENFPQSPPENVPAEPEELAVLPPPQPSRARPSVPSFPRAPSPSAVESSESRERTSDRTGSEQSGSGDLEDRARNAKPLEPPRVSQVKSYFQQRWQPPDNLPGTLEYRLHLASDGSLERITPLGEVARTYLDRTPMPQLGKPFVTPASNYQTLQMRLILGIDGSVQTIWESSGG